MDNQTFACVRLRLHPNERSPPTQTRLVINVPSSVKSFRPFSLVQVILFLLFFTGVSRLSAAIHTWVGGGGPWINHMNWSPQSVPGAGDTALIPGTHELIIGIFQSISVGTIVVENPNATLRLVGSGSEGDAQLTVSRGLINHGVIELVSSNANYGASLSLTSGVLTNAAGGVLRSAVGDGGRRTIWAEVDNRGRIEVEQDLLLDGQVVNAGTIHLPAGRTLSATVPTVWTHRQGAITGSGILSLVSQSTFVLDTDFTPGAFVLNALGLTVEGPGRLLGPTEGAFQIRQWTVNTEVVVTGDLRITGSVNFNRAVTVAPGKVMRIEGDQVAGEGQLTVASGLLNQGVIELDSSNGNYGASLTLTGGVLTNAAGGTVRAVAGDGGRRTITADVDNRGQLIVMAGVNVDINGALLNAPSGTLGGAGTFDLAQATVTNDGTVAPGTSPGILSVSGNLSFTANSLVDAEIGGPAPGIEYDRLSVSGSIGLGGAIRARLVGGYFPVKDDAFTVLSYASGNGTFSRLENPLPERIAWKVDYGANSAQLVVLNTAPTLGEISGQTVDEQALFTLVARATDRDLPTQAMTYSLVAAPGGMTIDPSSGEIRWTPTEAQGPGTYNVVVRVTDSGTPPLAHATGFAVTVRELNSAPTVNVPSLRQVHAGSTVLVTAAGSDSDIPLQGLTYAKVSGPDDATVTGVGLISWTPGERDANTTNAIVVMATDNGVPPLSATNRLVVWVHPRPRLTSLSKTGNAALAEWTAIPGTSYLLQYSTNLAGSPWLDLAGEVTSSEVTAAKADETARTNAIRFYRILVRP